MANHLSARGRDKTVDKRVGTRLRVLRLARDMTQEELAKALGLTFQQVQKYEKGLNAIASTRMPRLCEILKIRPNDLFTGMTFGEPVPVQVGSVALTIGVRVEKLGETYRPAFVAVLSILENLSGARK